MPTRISAVIPLLAVLVAGCNRPADVRQRRSLVTNGAVHAIAQGADGITYLGGEFSQVGQGTGGGVALDARSGRLTGAFPPVDGTVGAVVGDGAGGWFIGGTFAHVGALDRQNLAHVLASGAVDPAWNPGANGAVNALALNGGLVAVGGDFTRIGGLDRSHLAALGSVGTDGAPSSWDPGLDGPVASLVSAGGVLRVGGLFTHAGVPATAQPYLAAYDASGNLAGWNPSPDGAVLSLAVDGGRVYLGGRFTSFTIDAGTVPRSHLAAFDATTGALVADWNPGPNLEVDALAASGGVLYAGGLFTLFTAGSQTTPRSYLAALDAAGGLTAWNPGPDQPVTALAAGGGLLYAGGSFRSVGGRARSFLAALDATGQATPWDPSANAAVLGLAVAGEVVCAGGTFTGMGNAPRNGLAALDAEGNLTLWNPDAGPGGVVDALLVSRGLIYAGGSFGTLGGQARNNQGALDAAGALEAWNPNPNGRVTSLASGGDVLYVGGGAGRGFTFIGGQPRANLAAIDLTGSAVASWNPGASGDVSALVASVDAVWVGGTFDTVQGQPRRALASVGSVTSATPGVATSFAPNPDGPVRALALADGVLYAGGEFATLASSDRRHLAAFDSMNQLTAWDPDADGPVLALAVAGETVYLGGAFAAVGGLTRSAAAAVGVAGTGSLTSWDPGAQGPVPAVLLALSPVGAAVDVGGTFTRIHASLLANYARLDR